MKVKQSIRKRITMCIIPIAVLLIFQVSGIVYIVTSYSSVMKYYTGFYNVLAEADSAISEYDVVMRSGEGRPISGYIVEITETYTRLKAAVRDLYANRFVIDDEVRFRIERVNSDMFLLEQFMDEAVTLGSSEAISGKYVSEMQLTMDIFFCKLSECRKITADYFATQGAAAISDAKVMGILLIISVCLFAGLVIFTYVFLHRRVATPIKDVYEWAMGFEKGYGDMNDLTWEKDDEIGKIKHAFNTVKKKLNYANALSEEYASAMKKLKSEEEIKEKFVKQLYDEKRDKEAISTAAKRDGLTGLYNRRTFDDVVNDYLRRRVNGAEAALFLIDMDNFKNVNDTLGHLAGDDALKMLAGAMRIALPEAHLGRYGGDEFIALFTNYNSVDDVKAAADMLCGKMRVDFSNAGKTVKLSVSIGIATTEGVSGYSELYMKADRALYFAKENGRDQFKLESEL